MASETLTFEQQAKIQRLEKALGYTYQNKDFLLRALTHRSVGARNNERLEFLGDSLVNFMIADILYHQFEKISEGDLSRIRAFLVKGDTLAEIAKEFNLSEFLKLGPGELKSGGFRRLSILADAVEAIIASIYEDGGLDQCRQFVQRIYDSRLGDLDPKEVGKDPKTRLQELLQSMQEPLPEYSVISVNGPAHAQMFTISCYVAKLNTKFEATASNRRKAEQKSAKQALAKLEELK